MDLIDKGLPIPYHCQLREILRQEAVTGRWPINEKLPSERELGARFQVSRPAVTWKRLGPTGTKQSWLASVPEPR